MKSLPTERELIRAIDQTNLKPETSEEEMRKFLEEAKNYGFIGAAILPRWVPLAAKILKGSDTRIVATVGFPLGTYPTELKVKEAEWIVENGLPDTEIDMVMNVALLKNGKYDLVREDISAVVKAAKGKTVKVIIEVPYLTKEEIAIACLLAESAGAHYVKTSTGFKGFRGWRPTTPDDVKYIKTIVGDRMKIKAAGGISTVGQALAILEAGANRIGTSSGVEIVEEFRNLAKAR